MQTNTQNKKGLGLSLVAVAVFILSFILALSDCSPAGGPDDKPESLTVGKGEALIIPVSEISETAAFYAVTVDGIQMEVIAVKAPDGSIRTAFNTCQVCYDSGRGYYEQSGDKLVCQNCGNQFAMSRVEAAAGGCNPWPIFPENKTVTDGSVTITYDFLIEAGEIFSNWKTAY